MKTRASFPSLSGPPARRIACAAWTAITLVLALVGRPAIAANAETRTTVVIDSGGHSLYADPWGNTLLNGGESNGEGALVEVGYYSAATVGNDFAGTWTPLAIQQPSIGTSTADGADSGSIAATILISGSVAGPPAGTPLAIRFYSQATVAGSYAYNAVSSDDWVWQSQAAPPVDPVIILSLNNPNLKWVGGAASAFKTSVSLSGSGVGEGSYQGYISDGTAGQDGFLQLAVGSSSSFTGKLEFDGQTYILRGAFESSGTWTGTAKSSSGKKVGLSLTIQAYSLTGTLTTATGVESITGGVNAGAQTPLQGAYTLVFEAPRATSSWQAYGYGTLKIDGTGGAKLTGELPDGSAYFVRTTLLANGTLLLNLPTRKGRLTGELFFRDVPGVSDADGALLWKHPNGYFSPGTTDTVSVLGSQYTAGALLGASGTAATVYPEACTLDFYANGLASSVATKTQVTAAGIFQSGAGGPTLVLTSTTGVFKGRVTLKEKHVPFSGVLFQKQQLGIGPVGGGLSGFDVLRAQ
jgi:hypothetical protein